MVQQQIEVQIQALLHNREHDDAPQVHARTPHIFPHTRLKVRLQNTEQLGMRYRIAVEALQAHDHR